MSCWAILPVKDFARAKLRLRKELGEAQCAALAAAMAQDVLDAISRAAGVDRCLIVGGRDARALAHSRGGDFCDDQDCADLAAAVQRAAAQAAGAGADCLLVIPGDLPALSAAHIDELLGLHQDGLTVCAANADGGTNALVLSPPGGFEFQYGPDSAARHLRAGIDGGLSVQQLSLPAFDRDVDAPADLAAVSQAGLGAATRACLLRFDSRPLMTARAAQA